MNRLELKAPETDELIADAKYAHSIGDTELEDAIYARLESLDAQRTNPESKSEQVNAAKKQQFDNLVNDMPWYEKAAVGAGRRLTDYSIGVQQLLGVDGADNKRKQFKQEEELYKELDNRSYLPAIGGLATDIATSYLPGGMLGLGAKAAGLNKAGQAIWDIASASTKYGLPTRMLGSGLSGMAQGATLSEDNNSKRLENALAGGVVGSAAPVAMKLTGKTINAVRRKWADPGLKALEDAAIANGVTLTAGDLAPTSIAKRIENSIEGIPFSGRKDTINAQNEQIKAMLSNNLESFRPQSIINGSDDDVGGILSESLKRQYGLNKAAVKTAYDDVSRLANASPSANIDVPNLRAATRGLLDEYPALFDNLEAPTRLKSKLVSLSGDLAPQPSAILGSNGKPAFFNNPELSFDDARWLRKQIGALSSQAETRANMGGGSRESAGKLNQLYGALASDMDNWAAKQGNKAIGDAYKKANALFAEKVIPYRDNKTIRKIVLQEADTDTVPGLLLKKDRGNLAETALKLMDQEGIDTAKYALVKDATENAFNKDLQSGLSSSSYLRKMKLGSTRDSVFSPKELEKLSTIEDILRAAKEAPRAGADPLTGNRLLPYSIAGTGGGTGFAVGGIPGALIGAAIPTLLGKTANSMSKSRALKGLLFADEKVLGDGALRDLGLMSFRNIRSNRQE